MRVHAPLVVASWQSPEEMDRSIPMLSKGEKYQYSIYQELKIMWIALKTLGLLPFSVQQPTAPRKRWSIMFALQAVYAASFYVGFTVFSIARISALKNRSPDKISNVSALMYMMIMIPHLFIGPLQWARMSHVLRFLDDWEEFQGCFLKVTSHPVRLRMFRLSSATIAFVVVSSIVAAFLLGHLIFENDFRGSYYYMYAVTQIDVLLTVWVMLCIASARAAEQLAERLGEDLSSSGENTGDLINGYHSAWLRLSQLTGDIGDVLCHAFNVIVFYWLTVMLLSAFQGAKLLANGCPMRMFFGIGGLAMHSFVSIHFFCYAGSYATNAVSKNFVKRLSEMQVKKGDTIKQLHEIAAAVSTHGAVVDLGGFYIVDRSLTISIMSAFVTYMVVLIQSATDEDKNSGCT